MNDNFWNDTKSIDIDTSWLKEGLEKMDFDKSCSWYDYLLSKIQVFDFLQEDSETVAGLFFIGFLKNEIREIHDTELMLQHHDSMIENYVSNKLTEVADKINYFIYNPQVKNIEEYKKIKRHFEVAIRYTKE